jgi:hypothetical protein
MCVICHPRWIFGSLHSTVFVCLLRGAQWLQNTQKNKIKSDLWYRKRPSFAAKGNTKKQKAWIRLDTRRFRNFYFLISWIHLNVAMFKHCEKRKRSQNYIQKGFKGWMSTNKAKRRICEPQDGNTRRGWGKLHNEELHYVTDFMLSLWLITDVNSVL